MAVLTIRNVPDDVHRALKAKALKHGRSTEAEIREILKNAVEHQNQVKLGSLLSTIRKEVGVIRLDTHRDKTPPSPLDFT
ncbi:FitA-like ribbon-helix-helix domain-containing protein [Cysteiniphilum sp. 6C5]|uniref:FitA-like ribbon-helix-helix domain-containing protein n=1 Tax=unclassified Cysteiniphilum TaxID=2610889 RepID=UPI003F85D3A8